MDANHGDSVGPFLIKGRTGCLCFQHDARQISDGNDGDEHDNDKRHHEGGTQAL